MMTPLAAAFIAGNTDCAFLSSWPGANGVGKVEDLFTHAEFRHQGIASALISLPNRYMHSPVEVVSLADLEAIPRLMAAFALSVKNGEEFKVRI